MVISWCFQQFFPLHSTFFWFLNGFFDMSFPVSHGFPNGPRLGPEVGDRQTTLEPESLRRCRRSFTQISDIYIYIYIHIYIYVYICIVSIGICRYLCDIYGYVYIYIYCEWISMGKLMTEPCSPEPWNHGLDLGKSSPNGRTIQVSEI